MSRVLFLLAFLVVLSIPHPTYALTPIVQCGFNGTICTACDFFTLSANIMRWLVALVTLVITLVMVAGGVRIITSQGNPTQLGKAKSMMLNALIGFIILLAAWLIIDTAMKLSKFGTGSELGPWNAVATDACKVAQGTYVPTGGTTGTTTTPTSTPNTGDRCDPSIADRVITIPSNLVSGAAEKALPETVENFRRMHEAAKADGITLLVTDGYRHPDEQWALRQQYGCTNPNSSQCPGGKQVAISCHEGGQGSNHQTGNALDINVGCGNGNGNCNTTAYKWLKANGGQFGFYNNIPTDPVHWSPTGR